MTFEKNMTFIAEYKIFIEKKAQIYIYINRRVREFEHEIETSLLN